MALNRMFDFTTFLRKNIFQYIINLLPWKGLRW